jgi:hypothetical protein
MVKLNETAAKAFAEGYNEKVEALNKGESDGGKTPYRANSWKGIGYERARQHKATLQMHECTNNPKRLSWGDVNKYFQF